MGRNSKLRAERKLNPPTPKPQKVSSPKSASPKKEMSIEEIAADYRAASDALKAKQQELVLATLGSHRLFKIALEKFPHPVRDWGGTWLVDGWEKMAIAFLELEELTDPTDYQEALKLLLGGALSIAGRSDFSPEGIEQIKRAGHQLGAIGGFDSMAKAIDCVPVELQGMPNVLWDQVHGWRS